MHRGYARLILSLALVFLTPLWGNAESISEDNMPVKIYIGEPLARIEGINWPKHDDGAIPLSHNIIKSGEYHLQFDDNDQ